MDQGSLLCVLNGYFPNKLTKGICAKITDRAKKLIAAQPLMASKACVLSRGQRTFTRNSGSN